MTQAPCLLFCNQKKKKTKKHITILFGRYLDPNLLNNGIQGPEILSNS